MSEFTNVVETFNTIIEDINAGRIKCDQGFECRHCFGSGFREVSDPQGSIYRGVARCGYCQYWNFRRQRNEA